MLFKRFLMFFYLVFLMKINGQSTASKQVITFTIEAPQLDTAKKIWLYLPKDYENSKKAYPVIYMHDTQNLFNIKTLCFGEWRVDEYLDSFTTNKSTSLGINHVGEKRIDELTPYSHEKYSGGKGDYYLSFIKKTLKPHIQQNYRILSQPNHTNLFDLSLGGLISFYTVIKYPESFSKAGILSSVFWTNPEVFELVENLDISNNIITNCEHNEKFWP